MAFCFDIEHELGDNVRLMLDEQLSLARVQVTAKRGQPAAAGIHKARKAFKRSRALLRLVRPGLKASEHRRENKAIRDLGRTLAEERDRTVGLDTLAWLRTYWDEPNERVIRSITKLLEAPAEPARRKGVADHRIDIDALVDGIDLCRQRIGRMSMKRVSIASIADGYCQSYGAGRKAYAALDLLTAADNDVHDLRKVVQHHWRQSDLLMPLWPDEMSVRANTARSISKAIGLDHDLSVLAHRVDAGLIDSAQRVDKAEFLTLCRSMQLQLRREVAPRLDRVYATPTAAFAKVLPIWWAAAAREAAEVREGTRTATSQLWPAV